MNIRKGILIAKDLAEDFFRMIIDFCLIVIIICIIFGVIGLLQNIFKGG